MSADAIVHELLNTTLNLKVIQALGADIAINGQIDRSRVAAKVFKDPKLLSALEALVHPAVFQEIEKLYKAACQTDQYTLFIVEIPLLFEIHAESNYDAVIAVLANETVAKRRFVAGGHTLQDYEQRMHRQLSPQTKSANATYTIHNNGSLEELKHQVAQLHDILILE